MEWNDTMKDLIENMEEILNMVRSTRCFLERVSMEGMSDTLNEEKELSGVCVNSTVNSVKLIVKYTERNGILI